MEEKWAVILLGEGRAAGTVLLHVRGTLHPGVMQEDGIAPGQTEQQRLLLSSSNIKVGCVGDMQ